MEDSVDLNEAVTATQEIPSYRPDAKARRYDRQLRLWASAGQRSLEQARVLLIGADAAGSQALKNLVLPGISHFTVLSSRLTTAQDVATDFFLHPNSIGEPIATQTVRYLSELNPSVEGVSRVHDPAELLKTDSEYFLSFTIIICSNVDPTLEASLAALLWQASSSVGGADIPLVSVRTSGFIGRIQIQLREHCVVDTHPDTTHTLRMDQPFAALEAHARGLNVDAMDSMEYSHVPYVVLLVRAGCQWKDEHGGKLPQSDEDKAEFKSRLRKAKRKGDEENYDEALAQAYHMWNPSEIPYDLKGLLEDDSVKTVSQNSKNLHILLHTLREYLETHPLPPTSPTLPDMHSSTISYVQLQNLYREQFKSDLAEFRAILDGILVGFELPADVIPDEEIEGFVRNSGGVAIVKGRELSATKESNVILSEIIDDHLMDEYSDNRLGVAQHLAVLAAERFYAKHGSWPGSGSGEGEAERKEMAEHILAVTGKQAGSLPNVVDEASAEVVRGGFGTPPTTAAFIGGLVAQEVIKLVTNQYAPLDNTVIVDLVHSTTKAFKL